jgi:hypothetical protein
MAGLGSAIGYAVGGAMEGLGKGMVANALQLREEAILDLRHRYRMEEIGASQSFTAKENELQRQFNAEESQTDREFRAGEGELNRAATLEANKRSNTELIETEDGLSAVVDGEATPVTENGKRIKKLLSSKNATDFDKKLALYNAIYPDDPETALEKAQGNNSTREDRARMIISATDAFLPEYGATKEQRESARQQAMEWVDTLLGTSTVPDKKADTTVKPAPVEAGEQAIKRQYPNARKARDGKWYVQDENGKWRPVEAN